MTGQEAKVLLRRAVNVYDNEIGNLKKACAAKDDRIAALEKQIADKDNEIEEKDNQIANGRRKVTFLFALIQRMRAARTIDDHKPAAKRDAESDDDRVASESTAAKKQRGDGFPCVKCDRSVMQDRNTNKPCGKTKYFEFKKMCAECRSN